MATTVGDEDRKEKAREYARIKRRLYFVDLAITVAYFLFWLFSGLSVAVRDLLTLPYPLQVAAYLIIFVAGHTLISFPLSYYSGFTLPKRYGISVQSLASWFADTFKSLILSIILLLIVGEVLYWLISSLPTLWWLPAGGFFLLFTVILANLGPVLILPLFFKLIPLPDQALADRLRTLAERAGTKVRGVFTMQMSTKSTAANAALMGLGNTRRIVLADTLLDRYTPEEIEVVLAHELGHHVHGDIVKGILLESFATMIGFFISSVVLATAVEVFGFRGVGDIAALPLLAIIMGAFMFLLTPIKNAYSRLVERDADRYALEMTEAPGSFETLMLKLADQNLSEPNPRKWVEILFYDHPPYEKRVSMAKSFANAKNRL